jgi:hypothetical protein
LSRQKARACGARGGGRQGRAGVLRPGKTAEHRAAGAGYMRNAEFLLKNFLLDYQRLKKYFSNG